MLSDLRDSGNIEQDADIVLMLYRPEMYGIERYKDGTPTQNICEVIVAKHRNGETGSCRLYFSKQFTRFHAVEETLQPPSRETKSAEAFHAPQPSPKSQSKTDILASADELMTRLGAQEIPSAPATPQSTPNAPSSTTPAVQKAETARPISGNQRYRSSNLQARSTSARSAGHEDRAPPSLPF